MKQPRRNLSLLDVQSQRLSQHTANGEQSQRLGTWHSSRAGAGGTKGSLRTGAPSPRVQRRARLCGDTAKQRRCRDAPEAVGSAASPSAASTCICSKDYCWQGQQAPPWQDRARMSCDSSYPCQHGWAAAGPPGRDSHPGCCHSHPGCCLPSTHSFNKKEKSIRVALPSPGDLTSLSSRQHTKSPAAGGYSKALRKPRLVSRPSSPTPLSHSPASPCWYVFLYASSASSAPALVPHAGDG